MHQAGQHLVALLGDPYLWAILISYFAFNSAVGALEAPDATSGKFYRWLFKFSNLFAGNLNRSARSHLLPAELSSLLAPLAQTPAPPLPPPSA